MTGSYRARILLDPASHTEVQVGDKPAKGRSSGAGREGCVQMLTATRCDGEEGRKTPGSR